MSNLGWFLVVFIAWLMGMSIAHLWDAQIEIRKRLDRIEKTTRIGRFR